MVCGSSASERHLKAALLFKCQTGQKQQRENGRAAWAHRMNVTADLSAIQESVQYEDSTQSSFWHVIDFFVVVVVVVGTNSFHLTSPHLG